VVDAHQRTDSVTSRRGAAAHYDVLMDLFLERFVDAQDDPPFGCDGYDTACAELRAGRKQTHWIWWVFPQLHGLGSSELSLAYGIASIAEARSYLAHPVLGPRLRTATDLLLAVPGSDAETILGATDATKARSSMTLFGRAAPDEACFRAVLDRFFGGVEDPETVKRLG